jgi:hypothetical protein
MKGTIFVALEELIQDKFGIDKWNLILKESNLDSKGVFTSGEIYPDKELVSILKKMQAILNKKSDHLLMVFGFYLSQYFYRKYPELYINQSFESFLISVNSVIHTEIKKLNIQTNPPTIILEKETHKIFYKSNRNLCPLAFGLIKGSASIFNTNIILKHDSQCQVKGCDHCEFSFEYRGF